MFYLFHHILPIKEYKVCTLLWVFFLSSSYTLFAQEKKDTSIYKTVYLEEALVTGQLVPNTKFNSFNKMKVITDKDIQKQGALRLQDVLIKENNIRMVQDPLLGSGINVQGMTGNDVKILIDGVPVVGRQNGNIDMNQINLSTISRIEIVEGPQSVAYGSNALGGVINLITNNKVENNWQAKVQAYYESVGLFQQNIQAGINKKNNQLKFNAGRYFFDGYDPSSNSDKRDILWNPKEQYTARVSYFLPFKENHSLKISSDFMNERIINRQERISAYSTNAPDDWYKTRRWRTDFSYNVRIHERWQFQTIFAGNIYQRNVEHFMKDLSTLTSYPTGNTNDKITNFLNRTSVTYIPVKDKLKVQLGYEFNGDKATGSRIKDSVQTLLDLGIYNVIQYQVSENIALQSGLRYTLNSKFKAPLVPSFNVKLTPDNRWNFRLSYSRGFRSPDIKELYFYFVDMNHNIRENPDLKAETSNNYQLSFEYRKKDAKRFYNTQLSAYFNEKSNAILLALYNISLNEYRYTNIGKLRSLGASFDVNYHLKRIQLNTGFTYAGVSNQFNTNAVVPNYYFTPEIKASLSYTIPKIETTVSIFSKYTGKQRLLVTAGDLSIQQPIMNGFTYADASISKDFWKNKISIQTGIKNLFDIKNVLTSGTAATIHSSGGNTQAMGWGRTFFVQCSYTIK